MQKVKNISGNKIEVAGHRLPAGHILEIEDTVDISPYIKEGLIKDVKEKPEEPAPKEESPKEEEKSKAPIEEQNKSKPELKPGAE